VAAPTAREISAAWLFVPASRHLGLSMDRGFHTIMSAQFFSALADNALLIAAIALLRARSAHPTAIRN
jgi:hypothetical protein